jgi:hypothetical protein
MSSIHYVLKSHHPMLYLVKISDSVREVSFSVIMLVMSMMLGFLSLGSRDSFGSRRGSNWLIM